MAKATPTAAAPFPQAGAWGCATGPSKEIPENSQAPDRSVLDLDLAAERLLEQLDLTLFHAQAEHRPFDLLDVEVQRPEQRRDVAAHHRTEVPLGALHEEMKEGALRGFHRNRIAVHQGMRVGIEADVHAVEDLIHRSLPHVQLRRPVLAHVTCLQIGCRFGRALIYALESRAWPEAASLSSGR